MAALPIFDRSSHHERNFHVIGGGGPRNQQEVQFFQDDNGISSGQAFLVGQLELQNPKLNEPLNSVTWQRDIVALTGGGAVETTSNYFVNYGTTGYNQWGIQGNKTTNIPIVQFNTSKDVFPVFNWANILQVSYWEMLKMDQIGRSINQIVDDGLRLNYNLTLNQNVYLGFPEEGTTGLVNSSLVTSTLAPAGASTSRTWALKTPQEMMNDVNFVLLQTWANSQYDLNGMANQILIPPSQYSLINNTLISSAGSRSVLNYLEENNLAAAQGRSLRILPCRQCIGVGSGSTDRMVAYVNDERFIHFNLPIPLMRAMTQPSVKDMAYLTAYVASIGTQKFLYYQPTYYLDGI